MKKQKIKKKKKVRKLQLKILGLMACSILLTMGIMMAVANFWYFIEIFAVDSDQNFRASNIAITYLTEEEIFDYVELAKRYDAGEATEQEVQELTESEHYQKLQEQLNVLCEKCSLNRLSFCWVDEEELNRYSKEEAKAGNWKPIVYSLSGYYNESECNENNEVPFASRYPTDMKELKRLYPSLLYNNAPEILAVNEKIQYAVTKIGSREDGNVCCIIAESDFSHISEDIRVMAILILISSLIFMSILFLLISRFLNKKIVAPINMVAEEAAEFKNNHMISEVLGTIKTKDEIQSLSEAILKMEQDINVYIENLTAITAEKERIAAELSVATHIQADMLPCIFPAFPDRKEFDIYASMAPAKEVGGDFYDFFLIDENHLVMVIGDVSGKGVPAALFMVISKTLIKNQSMISESPKEILEIVNSQLYENNAEGMFVTVWLGIMEISTGKIIASNAGHEYPAIRKKDGSFKLFKDKHGLVVGAMPKIRYKEYEFQLEKGDTLFVYTDGVPEATNAENQLYGTDRMIEALNQKKDIVPEQILSEVRQDVDKFVAEAPQFDDLTMLCIQYLGI